MKTTQTKIIKIGNSYGVRVSKSFLDQKKLILGQTVSIDMNPAKPNRQKAMQALRNLAAMNGALSQIEDPSAWQREIRKDRKIDR